MDEPTIYATVTALGEKTYRSSPPTKDVVRSVESFPPIIEQAKGFMHSAAKAISSGFKQADDYAERWEICQGCEKLQEKRCLMCGCWMEGKAKFAAVHCDLGKW